MIIEKSGLLINANKEPIQWVNAGDEFDVKEGDIVVSHGKTANKYGVTEAYAAAKPKKAGTGRTKTEVPTSGQYSCNAKKMRADNTDRGAVVYALMNNSDLSGFFSAVPDTFTSVNKEGVERKVSTKRFVAYALRRGMIQLAA